VAGWGSICGSLPPAAVFISLFTDEATQVKLVDQLMAWYQQAPFPMYQPEKLNLPQTVAESTLCHVSITKFLKEGNGAWDMKSHEKHARCGGLSADVAVFTINMLNDHFDNKFETLYKPAAGVSECKKCHGSFTQGKDSCTECHGGLVDPHPGGF
jgi:hypothetical protein